MKRFTLIMVLLISIMLLAGCSNSDLELERSQLQSEIEELQAVRDGLIQKDDIVYILELQISQSHFTLDFEEHMKDSMNKITIPIQVSEEYYYSIEKGDILNNEFRFGSYIFKGSIGSWKIKVIDKQTVTITE